jgi:hypothetical protein
MAIPRAPINGTDSDGCQEMYSRTLVIPITSVLDPARCARQGRRLHGNPRNFHDATHQSLPVRLAWQVCDETDCRKKQ